MAITPTVIQEYFERYGWTFDRQGESDFLTGFRGDVSLYRIRVRLAGDWVYFSIAPLIVAPQDSDCEHKLYRRLLKLNHEMNMAKFTVDSDGDIILTVELPSASLDYGEFSDALGALAYYADDNYAPLFVLAHVPDAHPLFEAKEDLDWESG